MNVALMPVRLEDTWVALEARFVNEVLGAQTCLLVPRATAQLPGVCAWRGRAIPVLQLTTLLGINRKDHATLERTLVITHRHNAVAMPVSEVRAVLFLQQDQLRPVHATNLGFTRHEVEWEGFLMAVIDLDALFEELLPASESRERIQGEA
jgi:chemotaxis signal transduction protein